jgi:hypothetical protein
MRETDLAQQQNAAAMIYVATSQQTQVNAASTITSHELLTPLARL